MSIPKEPWCDVSDLKSQLSPDSEIDGLSVAQLQLTMAKSSQDVVLQRFRKELVADNILHQGDSIGTDDETLWLGCSFHSIYNPCSLSLRRFLRARKFDLVQSKKMFAACQHWRKTVEDVGIDELYREIDPFEASSLVYE